MGTYTRYAALCVLITGAACTAPPQQHFAAGPHKAGLAQPNLATGPVSATAPMPRPSRSPATRAEVALSSVYWEKAIPAGPTHAGKQADGSYVFSVSGAGLIALPRPHISRDILANL